VSDEDISDDIESVKLTAQNSDYFAIDPELAVVSTPTMPTMPIPSPPQQQEQQPRSPSPSPQS